MKGVNRLVGANCVAAQSQCWPRNRRQLCYGTEQRWLQTLRA
jgi:hypothetical protein